MYSIMAVEHCFAAARLLPRLLLSGVHRKAWASSWTLRKRKVLG